MPGRAEFFAAQARHAQRPLPNNQKPKPVDDSLWIERGMETCRELSELTDNVWGKVGFASAMGVSEEEAERRLRLMSRNGYLQMAVERAPSGDFIRYTWSLRDRSLPRKSELKSE